MLRPFTNSFVVVYLDDILIFNKSWEEHLQHIQSVLQTIQQHKLCANLEKCTFGMSQVQFLGYIIDEWGMHVDSTKIQVIRDWPTLTTLTDLCSFLGLANFYRGFVLVLSHITWPLSQVTEVERKKSSPILSPNRRCLLRQTLLTMLSAQSSHSKGIQWPSIVRHFPIYFKSTPQMIKSCIISYMLVGNGIIAFWGRIWSST